MRSQFRTLLIKIHEATALIPRSAISICLADQKINFLIKKLLAITDCKEARNLNCLDRKRTRNHLAKLAIRYTGKIPSVHCQKILLLSRSDIEKYIPLLIAMWRRTLGKVAKLYLNPQKSILKHCLINVAYLLEKRSLIVPSSNRHITISKEICDAHKLFCGPVLLIYCAVKVDIFHCRVLILQPSRYLPVQS